MLETIAKISPKGFNLSSACPLKLNIVIPIIETIKPIKKLI